MKHGGMSKKEFDDALQRNVDKGYLRIQYDPKHPNDPKISITDKLKQDMEVNRLKVMNAFLAIGERDPDIKKNGLSIDEMMARLTEETKLHPLIILYILEWMESKKMITLKDD